MTVSKLDRSEAIVPMSLGSADSRCGDAKTAVQPRDAAGRQAAEDGPWPLVRDIGERIALNLRFDEVRGVNGGPGSHSSCESARQRRRAL